jgi:hypothetical protein
MARFTKHSSMMRATTLAKTEFEIYRYVAAGRNENMLPPIFPQEFDLVTGKVPDYRRRRNES